MNNAQMVKQAFDKPGMVAATFTGNYIVYRDGERAVFGFDPPKTLAEKRNKAGRTTMWRGRYADGSAVEFTWGDVAGGRVRVLK